MWLNECNAMHYSWQKPFTKYIDSDKAVGRSMAIIVKMCHLNFINSGKLRKQFCYLLLTKIPENNFDTFVQKATRLITELAYSLKFVHIVPFIWFVYIEIVDFAVPVCSNGRFAEASLCHSVDLFNNLLLVHRVY